jgi:hypothetical protein
MRRWLQFGILALLFVSSSALATGSLYVRLIQFNANLATTRSTASNIDRQLAAIQAFNEQRVGQARYDSRNTYFTVVYYDGGTEKYFCANPLTMPCSWPF